MQHHVFRTMFLKLLFDICCTGMSLQMSLQYVKHHTWFVLYQHVTA